MYGIGDGAAGVYGADKFEQYRFTYGVTEYDTYTLTHSDFAFCTFSD